MSGDKSHPEYNPITSISLDNKNFDPLTGKRLQLAFHNGFSTFNDEPAKSEPFHLHIQSGFWQTLVSSKITSQDGPIKHQCDLSMKRDLAKGQSSKKISGLVNFDGKVLGETQDAYFKEFFKSWENPVIGVSKDRMLEAQLDMMLPKQRRFINGAGSLVFSKNSLEEIQVVGQVDNKFIACLMKISDKEKHEPLFLLLIDQHAAHERIRLEQLQRDFLEDLEHLNGKVTSIKLDSPVHLGLTVSAEQLFRTFKEAFKKIGIEYSIKKELKIEENTYVELLITSMPSIFVKISFETAAKNKVCVLEHSTIKELFYTHMKTHEESHSSLQVIPHSINNVLCTYACHGAIRFGDPLTLTECQSMIQSLSKCKMPFQCAHGRPSIAPLINPSSYAGQTAHHKMEKPALWKLRK